MLIKLRGGQGLIRAPFFLFHMCGRAIHITHWVCKKSVPFLRTDKIGYFRESNSRWHALGMLSWAALDAVRSTELELGCQRWFLIVLSSVQWPVLRPTYVRCRTKHANFMYREGCIWMKVCQRWCQLHRGPLQASLCLQVSVGFMQHATAVTRLSSCWLSESAQTLSHHVLMKTNDFRGLPYSEAGRASLSRLEGQGLQGTLSAVAICMKRIL